MLTSLTPSQFENLSTVKNVELDKKIKKIPPRCFTNCTTIESITIPSSIRTIGYKAFYGSSIRRIIFEDKSQLVEIHPYAFSNTHQLEYVSIPASVRVLGKNSFSNSNISAMNIPYNSRLQYIGASCFRDCSKLSSFIFPSSLIEIGNSAFSNSNISTFTPHTSNLQAFENIRLRYISSFCFNRCKLLVNFHIYPNITTFAPNAFSDNGTQLITYDPMNCKLERIARHCFLDCSVLAEFHPIDISFDNTITPLKSSSPFLLENTVLFPESLLSIGKFAFRSTKVGILRIPTLTFLRTIPEGCFSFCLFLQKAYISPHVRVLKHIAFSSSTVQTVSFTRYLRKDNIILTQYDDDVDRQAPPSEPIHDQTDSEEERNQQHRRHNHRIRLSLRNRLHRRNRQNNREYHNLLRDRALHVASTTNISTTQPNQHHLNGSSYPFDLMNQQSLQIQLDYNNTINVIERIAPYSIFYNTNCIDEEDMNLGKRVDSELEKLLSSSHSFKYQLHSDMNELNGNNGIIGNGSLFTQDTPAFQFDNQQNLQQQQQQHQQHQHQHQQLHQQLLQQQILQQNLDQQNLEQQRRTIQQQLHRRHEGHPIIFPPSPTSNTTDPIDTTTMMTSQSYKNSYNLLTTILSSATPTDFTNSELFSINRSCFHLCAILRWFHVPKNVRLIDSHSFAYTGINWFHLDKDTKIRAIPMDCFRFCYLLHYIQIPSSVTRINCNAFGSSGLKKIEFARPCNVHTIEKAAFVGCQHLDEIEIPKSVQVLGPAALQNTNCRRITIERNSKLRQIQTSCFSYCVKLEQKVNIPPNIYLGDDLYIGSLCESVFSTIRNMWNRMWKH